MIESPPAIYDHEPTEPYRIIELAPAEVIEACYGIRLACAIPLHRIIIIANTLEGEERERVLRHEKSHLNGWVHDGPICVFPHTDRCI